jgi:hypothetical protein
VNFKKTIASLTLAAATVFPMTAEAQTAKEWNDLAKKNPVTALEDLSRAFVAAKTKLAIHYRQVNNTARAEIVEKLRPNIDELAGRVCIVADIVPDADVEDVAHKYIVDISRDLMMAGKPSAPASKR